MKNRYIIYLTILLALLIIYTIYKFIKKEFFNNKITSLKDLILISNLITFIYIFLSYMGEYRYHMTYLKAIILMISLAILIFIYRLIKNKIKIYTKNTKYYIVLYLILLISITMFMGRGVIKFDFKNFENFTVFNNIIPFDSIKKFIIHSTFKTKIYHIGGNLVMLMPLSFLLILNNDKYKNILNQIKVILPFTFIIELLQVFSSTGSFDIDDIILNVSGSIIFTIIITKFDIAGKLKKMFYKDFKLKDSTKYILFILSCIIPISFLIDSLIITINNLLI